MKNKFYWIGGLICIGGTQLLIRVGEQSIVDATLIVGIPIIIALLAMSLHELVEIQINTEKKFREEIEEYIRLKLLKIKLDEMK